MKKLKKGDEVIVIAGRDKGRRGKVARRVDDEHLVVEGVNVVKKHVKPNPMKNEPGGIIELAKPIHQSNLAIFNPQTSKADRVRVVVRTEGEGKQRRTVRERVFVSTGDQIGV